MTKHIHAELMMQYAKDAMESETPWEQWEWYDSGTYNWDTLKGNPFWNEDIKYRKKQKKCYLNGIEVPELGLSVDLQDYGKANITISINSVTAYSKIFKSQAGAEAYAKALITSIKEEIK